MADLSPDHPLVAPHVKAIIDRSRRPIFKAIVEVMVHAPDIETVEQCDEIMKNIASAKRHPRVFRHIKNLKDQKSAHIGAKIKVNSASLIPIPSSVHKEIIF